MTEVAEAIYQNGTLKLLKPLSAKIKEGEKVKLTVEVEAISPEEMLELAGKVYEGLSQDEIDELEKIILDRSNFFGGRTL